jgi:hypothetical protein
MKQHTSIISTLLSATFLFTATLSAEVSIQCPGGHCKVVLPNKQELKDVPQFLKRKLKNTSHLVFNSIKSTTEKYVSKANKVIENVSDNVAEIETIFASSYVMTKAEKTAYYKQQAEEAKLKKEAQDKRDSILESNKDIEKIIIEQADNSGTAISEFFCEKDKKVRLLKGKNLFECV